MVDLNSALTDAYKRTRYLLWEQRSWARWWRYLLLSTMTGGSGSGGGFNFQIPAGSLNQTKKETALLGMMVASGAIGSWNSGMIVVAAALTMLLMLVGIFFLWLSNCAQFVLIESLVYDRHSLMEPLGRLKGRGTSLFLWSIVAFLALFVPAGVGLGGSAAAIFYGLKDHPGLLVIGGLLLLACGLGVLLLAGAVFATTCQLVAPLMYRQRLSTTAAWSLAWQTLSVRKADWFLFLICLLGLTLGGGVAVMFGLILVVIVTAIVLGLVLGLPAFLCYSSHYVVPAIILLCLLAVALLGTALLTSLVLQTPVAVMVRCFSMYVLQQMMPEYGFLPLGGRPDHPVEGEESLGEPAPLGSLHDEADWQRPEL